MGKAIVVALKDVIMIGDIHKKLSSIVMFSEFIGLVSVTTLKTERYGKTNKKRTNGFYKGQSCD